MICKCINFISSYFFKLFSFLSIQDRQQFEQTVKVPTEFPCGVACQIDGKLEQIIGKYKHHVILMTSPSVMYFLTLILAMYYTLELNYPKKYLQAMGGGGLGWYVLDDRYYKLGSKATKKLSQLTHL